MTCLCSTILESLLERLRWQGAGFFWRLPHSNVGTLTEMVQGSAGTYWPKHLHMAFPWTLGPLIKWLPQSKQTSLRGESDLQEQVISEQSGTCIFFYDLALEVTYWHFHSTLLVETVPKPAHIQGEGTQTLTLDLRCFKEYAGMF